MTHLLKIKNTNRVNFKVHTLLSRIRWQIDKTLLLASNRKLHMTFRLKYLRLTLALKVKVKVVHISTSNISKMATDETNITIRIRKSRIGFRLTYLHLMIAYYKVQGEGHAYFYCWPLWNLSTFHFSICLRICVAFSWSTVVSSRQELYDCRILHKSLIFFADISRSFFKEFFVFAILGSWKCVAKYFNLVIYHGICNWPAGINWLKADAESRSSGTISLLSYHLLESTDGRWLAV